VEEVYDKLIGYSKQWNDLVNENPANYQLYIESERFPRNPMLFAFEVITDFHSLRADIENRILELEAGDGIPDEENPDHHFIVSDYMRTLLTPGCEIIAGNTIFLTGRYQDVIIFDLDFEKLEQTKSLWRQYGETEGTVKAVQLGLAEPIYSSTYEDGTDPCEALCQALHLEHKLLPSSNSCPNKYQFSISNSFVGTCNCIINGTQNIMWNFGDGTSGSGSSVTHEYQRGGTYNVTLTIKLHDGGSEKVCRKSITLNVETCNVTINSPVKDNTYTESGVKYIFTANASNCNGGTPEKYIWNFGDGTTMETNTDRTEHVYTVDSKRTVTVSVEYSDCSASNSFIIVVSGTGNCCKKYTGDGIGLNFCYDQNGVPSSHDNATYKLSHFFTTRQWYLWHRIVVKNTLYKRDNKGKWKEKTASMMYANFSGQIAKTSCNLYSISPKGDITRNNTNHSYDYGVGEWFWVGKESLSSEFELYIYSTQVDQKRDVIKIHQSSDCQ
jgi:hypothetical protein